MSRTKCCRLVWWMVTGQVNKAWKVKQTAHRLRVYILYCRMNAEEGYRLSNKANRDENESRVKYTESSVFTHRSCAMLLCQSNHALLTWAFKINGFRSQFKPINMFTRQDKLFYYHYIQQEKCFNTFQWFLLSLHVCVVSNVSTRRDRRWM